MHSVAEISFSQTIPVHLDFGSMPGALRVLLQELGDPAYLTVRSGEASEGWCSRIKARPTD